MANEISTAGITVKYAVETTAGTLPTTGFTAIPNVKSIGDLNPEPATYEVTDLADTEWKRYIPALKDVGGALSLTVNLTSAFKTAWESLVKAAETGLTSSKATWFEFVIPGWTESFYIAGVPASIGLPSIETDSVLECDVYITPNQVKGWATASK